MNYRTERLPVITLVLIGINVLVYVVSTICSFNTDGESQRWVYTHLWLAPATSPWYAYLTSMFVHGGILHLLGNMIYLFLFGCCVEDLIGRWRFLIFYLIGGFVAELFFIGVSPLHFASRVPLGGASGAISACLGMYLVLRPEADIEFKYFYVFWMIIFRFGAGEFEVPAWMAIGFWFLRDLASMVWGIYFPARRGGGVAFGAHVGGLLAGLGLVAVFRLAAAKRAQAITSTEILSPGDIAAAASVNNAQASFEIPTIYLQEHGAQTGPHTLEQVQARLARGELAADTLYWTEGMRQWESVGDLAEHPAT